MADSKLRVNLIGDASSLNRSLQVASKRLETFGKRATQVGKDLSLRLTLPIGLAAGAAIKMASDMEESTNKVRVAFGSSSKSVEAFAKTALRSFGIAESSALDMTALFGDMATGMGVSQSEAANLSTQLVGLAGDLASFKNINIAEVTTALSGVFTGETESLKRLGIVMTEVNLEQFRLNEGINKSVKEMTQQEKIMLRLRYIFSVTKNAQGDFSRTSEGAANQMRIFQETLKEVGASLGEVLLPAFTRAITKVNELLDDFKNLDEGTKETIVQFGLLVAAVPPLLYAIGKISTAISLLNGKFLIITGTIAALTIAFDGFGDVLDQTATKEDKIKGLFKTLLAPAGAAMRFGYNVFGQIVNGSEEADKALRNFTAINQFEKTNKKAQETLDALSDSFGQLPFGKGDKRSIITLIGGESELTTMETKAKETAAALDNMLSTDATLTYALATESAAVESFGNVVKQTADEVRTPMEVLKEKFKDLSEASVNMIMQVGSSLTAAFNDMLNGENVFESLAKSLGALIKRLIAAAAAAAILSAFLGGTPALEFLGGFKGIFGSLSGLGSFSPGSAIGAPRGSGLGMGNLGIQGAMRGDNINLSGQFRIDGQDLVVAVERANNQRSNFTG